MALPVPGAGDTVNLTLPAESHVRKIALNITTVPYDPSSPLYPESVRVLFDDRPIYEFKGTGFGAFGRQEYTSGPSREFSANFSTDGGSNSTSVRLPRKAVVENATFELECSGRAKLVELQNITNSGTYSTFGDSVAGAGDLDGDGYGDILIGDPTYSGNGSNSGRATVCFGGADLANPRMLNLTDGSLGSYYGSSVAGAGDVNGDGFDDALVGAFGYSVGTGWYMGAAYLYFGGSPMDAIPDVAFVGDQYYGELGYSVDGAGDLNGDGYDDILIGQPYNNSILPYSGAAFVHLGGRNMDTVPDLVLWGTKSYGYFGASVTGAGDLNGDGRPDIAIGATGVDADGPYSGETRIFFGGPGMDNATDVRLCGHGGSEYFGNDAAAAGDVNGDGFGDLIVGACQNNSKGMYTGAAYLYLGGKNMDGTADLVLEGASDMDQLGASVAGGFDIDQDGYDDLAAGAPYESGIAAYAGRVYIYFGGPSMDPTPDANKSRVGSYNMMGTSIAGPGDINGDGREEFLAGAPGWSGMGGGGRVIIFGTVDGVLDPRLEVASQSAFGLAGHINRTFATPDLSDIVNENLRKAGASGWDAFGNIYNDMSLKVSGQSEGSIRLRLLNLTYHLSVALPDFSESLNAWMQAHRKQADRDGNLRIPLRVESLTPGRVRFTDLSITIDEAPRLRMPIPDAQLDEDSFQNDLVDLGAFFEDDFDSASQMSFCIVSSGFPDIVTTSINNGRYLSVDALEGGQNDNWTGTVEVVVRAEDHWGSGRSSNTFRIHVRNINDPPVITSEPPLEARGDVELVYRVLATDGDRDRLTFGLAVAPAGMDINGSTGVITWIPQKWGRYRVAASCSDGLSVVWQNFTVAVPNRPPAITSQPRTGAFIGEQYSYSVSATDPDGDPLTFSLGTNLDGFAIDWSTGLVSGIPMLLGDHELVITVSDGRAEAFQTFTLSVVWPNRSPFISSNPATTAQEGLPYSYDVRARDSDGDELEFSLETGPPWLSMDGGSGRLNGTPEKAGNFTVAIRAVDGRGGECRQEFTLRVADSIAPALTLDPPGGKARGVIQLSGRVVRGTRDILRVEVRLDGGEWRRADLNATWNLTLDTGRLRDGAHTVEVRAYDGWEHSTVVKGVLEVDNSSVIRAGGTGPVTGLVFAGALAAAAAVAGAALVAGRLRTSSRRDRPPRHQHETPGGGGKG